MFYLLFFTQGLFSRITFREPVFIGGRGNTSGLAERFPTDRGFVGCVRLLQANDHRYDFGETPAGDTVKSQGVGKCKIYILKLYLNSVGRLKTSSTAIGIKNIDSFISVKNICLFLILKTQFYLFKQRLKT